MIRGTTPTLEFIVPFDTDLLKNAYITLSQNNKVVINKQLNDCEIDIRKLSVKLSQEETLQLSSRYRAEIQVKVKFKDSEDVFASNIIYTDIDKILNEEVI